MNVLSMMYESFGFSQVCAVLIFMVKWKDLHHHHHHNPHDFLADDTCSFYTHLRRVEILIPAGTVGPAVGLPTPSFDQICNGGWSWRIPVGTGTSFHPYPVAGS